MLAVSLYQLSNIQYPNIIYTLADNSIYLAMMFGACGILGEVENNENMHKCLKTNLKIASNFLLIGSLLHLYRINRI